MSHLWIPSQQREVLTDYSRPVIGGYLHLWKAKIWVTTLIAGNVAWIWPSTASILKSLLSYQGSECFRNISKTSEPMMKIVCFLTPASLGKALQPHLWGCGSKQNFSPLLLQSSAPTWRVRSWDFNPSRMRFRLEKAPSEFEPFQPSNWLIERSFNASAFWVLKYFSGITLHPKVSYVFQVDKASTLKRFPSKRTHRKKASNTLSNTTSKVVNFQDATARRRSAQWSSGFRYSFLKQRGID